MRTSATEPRRRTFFLISSWFVFLAAMGIGNCFMRRGLRFFFAASHSIKGSSTEDESTGNRGDRKSTRLNSSHLGISYAVFCLKKKKESEHNTAHAMNS